MVTEVIDIKIREDGSRVVKRNLSDLGSGAEKAADGVDLLKRALGAIAAFMAVDKVKQYADAWASAAGQIRVATKSTEEAAAVTENLFKVAQTTRQGFGDIVDLYSRVARSGKELGVSQNQLVKFTENVGKTLASSATDSTKAQGALLQLGQALGRGIVQAEEFNSILEGTPAIMQAVANNIKGADGSIGKLRQIMLDGKLTSKDFFEAIMNGSKGIDKDFEKSAFTISQGLTLVSNSFMKWIGEMDQSLGVSQKFGQAARWIAENMKLVITVLGSLAVAIAVAFTPTVIMTFAAAVGNLWKVIAANPFLMLAAAIAAAVVYLSVFKDEINAGIDKTTTLGDVFRSLGEQAKAGFQAMVELAEWAFSSIEKLFKGNSESITKQNEKTTQTLSQQYSDAYSGVGSGFAGVVKSIARTFDAIVGLVTGVVIAIVRAFAGIPGAISELFKRTYNAIVSVMENIVNTVINGVNSMREAVGMSLIDTIKLDRKEVDTKFFENYGKDIGNSINDGFAAVVGDGFLEKWVDGVFSRAQQIGKDRKPKGSSGPDLNAPMGDFQPPGLSEKELEKQRKELEKFKNELRSLLNTIAPVEGAKLEMAKAQDTLSEAVRRGIITTQEEARYLELLDMHYRDILDPLGKVNREIDEQVRLLGMSSRARQIETQMLAIEKDLRSQGIVLTQDETAAMRTKLETLQKLNEQTAAQDQLLANSVEKRRAFSTQGDAINANLADPNSGFTKGDAAIASSDMISQMGLDPSVTQAGIDAQLAQFQNMYDQIDIMREKNLISEQTAMQLASQVDIKQQQMRLQNYQTFFGSLATLSKSGNSKIAAIGRAAAVTQATIDGVLAVQKALASAPPPINYALAAAVGAAAAANVAQILGTNLGFMTGGSFKVGGSGGADSQMVAFRASPGERVDVSTPTQVRKGDPNKDGGKGSNSAQTGSIRIVNVLDESIVQDFLESSSGDKVFMNLMQRNSSGIKALIED